MNEESSFLEDLKKVSEVSLFSILGITALFITFALIAHSETLVTYFMWSMAGIMVKVFGLISIRIMLRENKYLFPYGTGKIENFSAFLFGVSIAPLGLYFLIVSIYKLFVPPGPVSYGLCLIPLAFAVTRSSILTFWLKKMMKRHPNPSPLMLSYQADFRVALISDSFLIAAFIVGWLLSMGRLDFIGIRIDPFLSATLSVIMIKSGTTLIIENMRSLLDLPLPENELLKVVKVMAEFYDSFEGLGRICTRRSGKFRVIEIELMFDPNISLLNVSETEKYMFERLSKELPGVRFRIIPRIQGSDYESTRKADTPANEIRPELQNIAWEDSPPRSTSEPMETEN